MSVYGSEIKKYEEVMFVQFHYYVLIILMAAAFYTDVKDLRIPNRLTFSTVLVSFLYHFIVNGWEGLIFSGLGCGAGVGIFILLYAFKAIGAGDVKLFGSIGAIMGLEFTLYSMMYSVIYAGLIGLIILLIRKQFLRRMTNLFYYFAGIVVGRNFSSIHYTSKHAVLTFPFMYAVLPAVATTGYYFI
jgi:prepilin peptidase CpaA